MKRRGRPPDQSHLDFDLPLRQPPSAAQGPAEETPAALAVEDLPLFPKADAPAAQQTEDAKDHLDLDPSGTRAEEVDPEGELAESVSLRARLLGGLADLAVQGGVLVLAILGQSLLGLAPSIALAPAYLVFLLAFSFLYWVVPLAFWGQTPGMASLGLVVRTAEGENLTFRQTAMRWLAAVTTLLLLGLPLLIALTGRSLGDRWSRSRTYRFHA